MHAAATTSLEVGLSLGSNLGNRLQNLAAARDAIAAIPGVMLMEQSPVYETEPVGVKPEYADMPYLNAVLIIACSLAPGTLSDTVHEIETRIGRKRTADRYAPRVIDIDILYIADMTINTPSLQVPHPAWASRRFVVGPLCDVRPELVLPGTQQTCAEVLSALPDQPDVVRFCGDW